MRVIAGEYKGRKLTSPEGYHLRPTPEKVREALFSILASEINGSRCMDLFAGSGSLGIEALSRGAEFCYFSDSSRRSISLIEKNLASAGAEEKSQVTCGDFRKVIKSFSESNPDIKIDIVFIDPPFDSGYYNAVMKLLFDYDIMRTGGIVVVEFDGVSDNRDDPKGFRLGDIRKYGRVGLEFWIRD